VPSCVFLRLQPVFVPVGGCAGQRSIGRPARTVPRASAAGAANRPAPPDQPRLHPGCLDVRRTGHAGCGVRTVRGDRRCLKGRMPWCRPRRPGKAGPFVAWTHRWSLASEAMRVPFLAAGACASGRTSHIRIDRVAERAVTDARDGYCPSCGPARRA
jgi:hypothetical protein